VGKSTFLRIELQDYFFIVRTGLASRMGFFARHTQASKKNPPRVCLDRAAEANRTRWKRVVYFK
jgi:hypothetical protein